MDLIGLGLGLGVGLGAGRARATPTAAAITGPAAGQSIVPGTQIPITWTVDRGSDLGEVFVDGVSIGSGHAGEPMYVVTEGDHTVYVAVAGGAVQSPTVGFAGRLSIAFVQAMGSFGVRIFFNGNLTADAGASPDANFVVDGAGFATIPGQFGGDNIDLSGYEGAGLAPGSSWALSGQPNWASTPIAAPASGTVTS